MMDTSCRDEERRALVREHKGAGGRPDWFGLNYIDVHDDEVTLDVYFLGKLPPALLQDHKRIKEHVRIRGGRRIRDIEVVRVTAHPDRNPTHDDYMQVQVDRPGDFTTYRLELVNVPDVDPQLASLDFSFKVNCPSDFDCAAPEICPPRVFDQPDINYLAKDYASFRQLILDRLALIMPDWHERHVPDLMIALTEVLAYTGDYLSYYQDAVATEAYLDTARKRISVRRHARLVDYVLHEGYNARAWVHVEVSRDTSFDPMEVEFLAGLMGLIPDGKPFVDVRQLERFAEGTFEVFEPLDRKNQVTLVQAHNEILFYTWGDRECCLPVGTTQATLVDTWEQPAQGGGQEQQGGKEHQGYGQGKYEEEHGHHGAPQPHSEHGEREEERRRGAPQNQTQQGPAQHGPAQLPARKLKLKVGDFLLFEEIMGPQTGIPGDADWRHRQIVRLTRVEAKEDKLVTDPVTHLPTPLLEIEWSRQDALTFPLCLSSLGPAPDCKYLDPVSVARGNLILVDQGQTITRDLDSVPAIEVGAGCDCEGHPGDVQYEAGLYEPILPFGPLIFSDPPRRPGPAATRLLQDPHRAAPWITLTTRTNDNQPEVKWTARPDLLGSGPEDANFVVEIDDDRIAHLRFGDGDTGRALDAGATVTATYRIALTSATVFGLGVISHMTKLDGILDSILEVRNPLAGVGPLPPQSMQEAKLLAPGQFKRDIQRGITADDYARIAERELKARIQRAAAELVWTGSWYEADVALDPYDSEHPGPRLLDAGEDILEHYRRIGYDLRVEQATYVPLDITLQVCVEPDYLRAHVEADLQDVLSNRVLSGGRLGFFHPDNLTFGQSIYISQLVAAAQAVPGVQSVQVKCFQRLFELPNGELEQGFLALGLLEIAQLDNDPSFPEHGRLTLEIGGGR